MGLEMPLFTLYVLLMDQNRFPKRAQRGRFEGHLGRVPDSQGGVGPFEVILVKKVGCQKPEFLTVWAIGQFWLSRKNKFLCDPALKGMPPCC